MKSRYSFFMLFTILDALKMPYNTKALPIYNWTIIECSNDKNVL